MHDPDEEDVAHLHGARARRDRQMRDVEGREGEGHALAGLAPDLATGEPPRRRVDSVDAAKTDGGHEQARDDLVDAIDPQALTFTAAPRPRTRKPRPEPSATQRALGLLTRREHSRRELTRKLVAKGVEREEVDRTIEKLCRAGWQDDARFAEALARMRANTGYGPVRIRAELGTHALDADAIGIALDAIEAEIDWRESAKDLVRRRIGSMRDADLAKRRKAADLLIRRGFDSDTVRATTRWDPDDDL